MRIIEDLRVMHQFFKFVQDPTETDRIFSINDITMESPHHKVGRDLTLNTCLQVGGFRQQLEVQYLPHPYKKEDLKNHPLGSLGQALYKHYETNNLDVDFYPHLDLASPMYYLVYRIYQTHDIWHVLTGYDTSVIGEMALQAFTFAQIQSAGNTMIMAAGMLNIADQDPHHQTELFEKMCEGYMRGKKAKPLLGVRWEEEFARPLEKVQEDMLLKSDV